MKLYQNKIDFKRLKRGEYSVKELEHMLTHQKLTDDEVDAIEWYIDEHSNVEFFREIEEF